MIGGPLLATGLLLLGVAGESRLLDDFERETPAPWRWSGPGELTMVDGRAPGARGSRVMRVATTAALRNNRMWWGELRLKPPAVIDWTAYHYVTVWARALGGRRIHSLALYVENGGKRLESHHVVLPAGQWTRVVYPVTHLRRDQVTVLFFSHNGGGALPGEAADEVYELDDLRLERGPTPVMAGWPVAAGRVAFAHNGYRPAEPKRILFPPSTRGEAVLRDAAGREKQRVAPKPDAFGNRVADLTGWREPGRYTVEAGGVRTEPFVVAGDAPLASARAVLRFIHLMRCGCKVEDEHVGHGPCHLDNCRPRLPKRTDAKHWPLARTHMTQLGDWFDLTGGWHDAGIVDQYTGNTGLMTYALVRLADTCPELRKAALAEAAWGGRWLVKATLPTGEMIDATGGEARWTDNRARTADDRPANVRGCWVDHAMKAVAGMASLAGRVHASDPALHAKLTAAVRRAVRHFKANRFPGYIETRFQFVSWGALAGLEAHAATGDDESRAFALHCLDRLLACQDPEAGFFYAGTGRKRPFRFVQGQAIGVLALARACRQWPEHSRQRAWRAAIGRWCDRYAVPMTRFAGGYGVMAFGLYNDNETKAYDGRESWWAKPYDRQVFAPWPEAKTALTLGTRRVRVFGAHRGGNNRYLCANAAALGAAARLLGRRDLNSTAADQLQWVAGRNPFSMSLISHTGHRWPLAYQPMIGDITGAMYQGIGSRAGDSPFLSPNCHHTQKEIWGVCAGLYLLATAETIQ